MWAIKTDALCNVSVMAMFSFGRAIPHSNEYENRPIYCFIMYSKTRGSSYTPKYNSTAEKLLLYIKKGPWSDCIALMAL